MDTDNQQTPPEGQRTSPTVDDLIAHTNAETYAFEGSNTKRTPKEWFFALPRTRKLLFVGGTIAILFTGIILGLTLGKEPPKQSAAMTTAYGTSDINGDGVIDEKDSAISGDTNGDGVVDSRDDAAANTTDSESASWWGNLFSKANSAIQSNSSDGDDASSSSSDDSSLEVDGDTDEQATTTDDEDESYIEEADPEESIPYQEEPSETEFEEPADPTPTEPSPTTSSSTLLTIASWNVLGLHNNGSKTKAGIDTIFKHAQVIGLQEVGTGDNERIRSIVKNLASSSVGVYQPMGNTPIVWNAKMYTKKASGYKVMDAYGIRKTATYVKLQNKANGKQFYVFNIHAPVGTYKPKENCSSNVCKGYKYVMKGFSKFIDTKASGNAPVFATGDYNANYRFDHTCKITWYPCHAFKKLGMYSGFAYTDLTGISASDSTAGSGKSLIDYVFASKRSDVTPVAMKIIAPGASCSKDSYGQTHCWNKSDHKPVLFTVRLK